MRGGVRAITIFSNNAHKGLNNNASSDLTEYGTRQRMKGVAAVEVDLPNIDLDKAEKAAKAIGYFWLLGAAVLGFLLVHWRAYKARRPRAQIVALRIEVDALRTEGDTLRTLLGELTKSVVANSTNIISITEQLQGIVGDAERKLALMRSEHETRFVRFVVHEDLSDRVQQLDDRLWELGGGSPRRRPVTPRRERQHDPRD